MPTLKIKCLFKIAHYRNILVSEDCVGELIRRAAASVLEEGGAGDNNLHERLFRFRRTLQFRGERVVLHTEQIEVFIRHPLGRLCKSWQVAWKQGFSGVRIVWGQLLLNQLGIAVRVDGETKFIQPVVI